MFKLIKTTDYVFRNSPSYLDIFNRINFKTFESDVEEVVKFNPVEHRFQKHLIDTLKKRIGLEYNNQYYVLRTKTILGWPIRFELRTITYNH